RETLLLRIEAVVRTLPFRWLVHWRDLNSRHFVLWAVGSPVGRVRRDHVSTRFREVESGVDHARLDVFSDVSTQHGFTGRRLDTNPVVLLDTFFCCIVRMDFQTIFAVPHIVERTTGLRANVVLRQDTTRGKDEREVLAWLLATAVELGWNEATLATHEFADVHGWRTFRSLVVARPLDAATEFVDALEAHTGEGWRQCSDFIHDFTWMLVVHWIAQCVRQHLRDFPVSVTGFWRHH